MIAYHDLFFSNELFSGTKCLEIPFSMHFSLAFLDRIKTFQFEVIVGVCAICVNGMILLMDQW